MTIRELTIVLLACALIGAGMVLVAVGAGSVAAPRLVVPAVVIR